MSKRPPPIPPILSHAGPILERYDVLYVDVWGVVHDGHRAIQSACDALVKFRALGGTVVLVSNAPVPKERVASMLDYRAVPRTAWDDIVSSGNIAIEHVRAKRYDAIHYVGPRDRDAAFFEKVAVEHVPMESAQAVVCTGLEDDTRETAETYRPLLEIALDRCLPFVCANPDIVVDVGGKLYPCAGAVAELYEKMGGEVFWAGKPHPSAYANARVAAERARGEPVETSQILAVGDSIRTDLAAAKGAGVDAIFVTTGIHRADVMTGGAIDAEKLAALFPPGTPGAVAAMDELRW